MDYMDVIMDGLFLETTGIAIIVNQINKAKITVAVDGGSLYQDIT